DYLFFGNYIIQQELKMSEWTDEIILSRLRSGSEKSVGEALQYLFSEYFGLIRHLTLKNSGTVLDAEDLFQDAVTIFYEQVVSGKLQLTCSVKTYLYSICRNQWSNQLRKRKEVELNDEGQEYIDIADSHLEALIETEAGRLIAQLIQQMGEECQKVLQYFYYDQMKMKKIAELMHYSGEQIAKNKKSKCLKALRNLVQGSSFYKKNLR
ncbi:MAG: sigma-70 family RNA polymerase sigma factor, partial [Bacteroidota bacterium]